jgi:hypothetical protein
MREYSIAKKDIGLAEREILMVQYGYHDLQNSPYMASREVLITRIAASNTSFTLLPCKAWHGYMVTNAHPLEVEVGAAGSASARPSGATAATPPAGVLSADLLWKSKL